MAKQKKKKKRSTLSVQERELVSLLKMRDNPATLFQEIMGCRSTSKQLMASLGLNIPSDPPADTAKANRILNKMMGDRSANEYGRAMRFLIEGYWISHRQTYVITPELLEFVKSDYWLFQSQMDYLKIVSEACQEPIVFDLSLLGLNKNIMCSKVSILPPCATKEAENISDHLNLFTIVFEAGGGVGVHITSEAGSSIKGYIEYQDNVKEEDGITWLPVARLLLYIGYLKYQNDENGQYLVQKQESGTRFEVKPMPRKADDPIIGSKPEWANSGARILLQYLERDNMIRDLREEIESSGIDPTAPVPTHCSEADTTFQWDLAVLEWERTRTIYLFDDKAGDALKEKYQNDFEQEGFLKGLVEYMPSNTIVLSYRGCVSYLVSKRKIEGQSGPGIVVQDLVVPVRVFARLTDGTSKTTAPPDQYKLMEAFCVLKHILITLKEREEKKLAEAPVTAKAAITTLPPKPDGKPAKPTLYEGSGIALEAPPVQMFEVTGRTVKKLSNKELVQRHGWTMTPHTRRSHAHRYWVGKGENRHLEVRWLQDMKINARLEYGEVVSTVVRKIG